MAEFSRAEAALRAGVDTEYLDRLIGLGLIKPEAHDRLTRIDVRKAKMMQTLEGAGIPPEAVVEGMRSTQLSLDFMESPVYERFATLSDESFRQVGERTGLPLDLLMLIREATGGAVPDPDDRV